MNKKNTLTLSIILLLSSFAAHGSVQKDSSVASSESPLHMTLTNDDVAAAEVAMPLASMSLSAASGADSSASSSAATVMNPRRKVKTTTYTPVDVASSDDESVEYNNLRMVGSRSATPTSAQLRAAAEDSPAGTPHLTPRASDGMALPAAAVAAAALASEGSPKSTPRQTTSPRFSPRPSTLATTTAVATEVAATAEDTK